MGDDFQRVPYTCYNSPWSRHSLSGATVMTSISVVP